MTRPREANLTILVTLFLVLSPSFVWAYPSVVINRAASAPLEGPLHHGLKVETNGIADPNLTSYEIQLKPDNGQLYPPWALYSEKVMPQDGAILNIPYRNGLFAMQGNQAYCVRIRAIYGSNLTPWAQRCGVTVDVPSSSTDDTDGDGLPDFREYVLGIDPRNADTDQDGVNDGIEVANGTDPGRKLMSDLIVLTPSLDFGEGNPFGQRRNQHQFIRLENVGEQSIQISAINVLDGSVPDSHFVFHVGAFPRTLTHIPPQSTYRIPVSFLPIRRGPIEAKVEIQSDNPEPVALIPVSGTGVGIPDCTVSPTLLDFGIVSVMDQNPSVREITISNGDPNNDDPLALDTPFGFTLSTTLPSWTNHPGMAPGTRGYVLKRGDHLSIPVFFQHQEAGDYDGFLEIRSAYCGIQRVELKGTAESP